MSQSMSDTSVKPVKKKNEAVETIKVVIEALLIALIFRTFLYQPFSIPTASMQSTMMIGDYFLANKWAWGFGPYSFPITMPFHGRFFEFGQPQRGDIAVFRNVTGEDYIKRIIGMPGDKLQMIQGRLYINGKLVEREEIGKSTDTDSDMSTVPVTLYKETLPNGVVHTIQEIADNAPYDNTGEFVVPAGHYFMMGDNRDRSADSRAGVGYVPAQALIGKAEVRFFSLKDNVAPWALWEWPTHLRLDRMFQSVYP